MRIALVALAALVVVAAAMSSTDGAQVAPSGAVQELGEMDGKEVAPVKEEAAEEATEEPKPALEKEEEDEKGGAEEAPSADGKEALESASAGGAAGGGLDSLASKANQKAELALNKIKTAKELRTKARAVLTAKGKPIPDILKKGALDDVHQRVMDARSKLHSKFGMTPKNDGELESKVQVKRESAPAAPIVPQIVNKDSGEAEKEKIRADAETKKAKMYKEKYQEAAKAEKATAGAAKTKVQAMQQKAAMDKKLTDAQSKSKVQELEVKMREKAKEEMAGPQSSEGDEDFNHRQIAQEAYNKQVMGYVMSWEKTHGGPAVPSKDEEKVKDNLNNFIGHYQDQHEKIKSDIQVADTPTRR